MIDTDLFLLNMPHVCPLHLAQLPALLSSDEHHHWRAISHPIRRQEYLLSRALLRQLLSDRLSLPAASLQFCHALHGKPQLHDAAWHFNLSHSGGWLALALGKLSPLGVDIELGKGRRDPLALARRFFAASEYQWLCSLPPFDQARAFYRLWSRKEAVLKAHGGGIAAGLEKVRFDPLRQWRLDNQLDEQIYQVQDWPFASGWLSLASASASVNMYHLDSRLNCQQINPMLLTTLIEESNP
ncbi:MAG: 4'-phosphopantetheinyl transferase family protein [Aeromonas sp.]